MRPSEALGKFEGCGDARLGQVLHSLSLDTSWLEDEINLENQDWYAFLEHRDKAYILYEDSDGFFTYQVFPLTDGRRIWDKFALGVRS